MKCSKIIWRTTIASKVSDKAWLNIPTFVGRQKLKTAGSTLYKMRCLIVQSIIDLYYAAAIFAENKIFCLASLTSRTHQNEYERPTQ
jgi:hypothetical protein